MGRFFKSVVPGVAFLMLLAGCSSEPHDARSASTYVAPAWMAEYRQQVEAYQVEMSNCIREMGAMPSAAPLGGVYSLAITEEDGVVPPEVEALMDESQRVCQDRIPGPSVLDPDVTRETYQMVLDVRECVLAQGYLVEDAPSWEKWEQTINSGTFGWTPYRELSDKEQISSEDLSDLINICHQAPHARYDNLT